MYTYLTMSVERNSLTMALLGPLFNKHSNTNYANLLSRFSSATFHPSRFKILCSVLNFHFNLASSFVHRELTYRPIFRLNVTPIDKRVPSQFQIFDKTTSSGKCTLSLYLNISLDISLIGRITMLYVRTN